MTFEEYRKHFEIFSKIDSPEKLAICESQYKMHLFQIEAWQHFEPFEEDSGDNDEVLSIDFDGLNNYLMFGSNGCGDPVCIDLSGQGEIVYLNHDNYFERIYQQK